ncbi:MAG TPA: protein kinase [Gemmatimonadota bacterium]|nr:protein kinase [Gemmatimonadota bacterium]
MADAFDRLAAALADRYRIERELGAGGMATVYLAADLKHDRKVALTVLKPELAAVLGAERFVQEIKTTASLQHPHILPLFDSGSADGFLYYVMPYIEGETLRDKLNRETQLGIDEAVRIASEVADALDYAHRNGVIHRDIKPENILLHDGRPMVADFGIALAVSAAAGGRMTETGLSLGTPHYMSPEQATAEKEITSRSDIYSLGCVTYEMLAGDPPHVGSTAQQIIMKIVTEEAQSVTRLRRSVPPNVAAALEKSLAKLAADRFESAARFAEALANPGFTLPAAQAAAVRAPAVDWQRRLTLPVAALAALLLVTTVWGWLRPPPDAPVSRLDLSLGSVSSGESQDVIISPDGSALAVTGTVDGTRAIFVRRLGEADFRMVPGTENGVFPGFSPDGQWLVFTNLTDNTLVKVAVSGGGSLTLVDEDSINPFFAHWGDDGTIVFFSLQGGIQYSVHSAGGPVELINGPRGVPRLLPDGSGVLVSRFGGGIFFIDFATDTFWTVVPDGRHPTYVDPGILLYVGQGGGLFAAPFDRRSHTITGPPMRVLDRVAATNVRRGYSLSRNGTLVHFEGEAFDGGSAQSLLIVNLDGGADTLRLPPEVMRRPRFSPDGRTIAFEVASDNGHDLYTYDLVTNTRTQITFEEDNDDPVWSPNGERILFDNEGEGSDAEDLWVKPADNSGPAQRVLSRPGNQWPLAWLDNDLIVFGSDETGNDDLVMYTLSGDSEPEPYLRAPWDENDFALSPDRSIAAHVSEKTGEPEVWLRDFPTPVGEWRVSFGGGEWPRWSPDGRTLYFWRRTSGVDTLFAASISRDQGMRVGAPQVVVAIETGEGWDLHPDGDRFIVLAPNARPPESSAASRYLVVLNWFEELKERMGN